MQAYNCTRVPKLPIVFFTILAIALSTFAIFGFILSYEEGDELANNTAARVMFSFIFLLGLSGFYLIYTFLAIIEWNEEEISSHNLIFGRKKTLHWFSLNGYERTTKLRTGFQYRLFGSGRTIAVDDWLHLRRNEGLRATLMKHVAPFLEEKVESALSSRSFEFRCRRRKNICIEGDIICHDQCSERLDELETIVVERFKTQYLKDCVQLEKYTLRFSSGREIEVSTPMNDLDVFLEILKRKALYAAWIDGKKEWNPSETPASEISSKRRTVILNNLKKRNKSSALLGLFLLLYPIFVFYAQIPRERWDDILERTKGPLLQRLIIGFVMLFALQVWLWVSFIKTRKKIKILESQSKLDRSKRT